LNTQTNLKAYVRQLMDERLVDSVDSVD